MIRLPSFSSRALIRIAKIAFVAFPVAVGFWILQKNLILATSSNVSFTPGHPSASISVDDPRMLVAPYANPNKLSWRMGDDVFRFTIRTPSRAQQTSTEIDLTDVDQDTLYFSPLNSKGDRIGNQLILNRYLDQLSWTRIEEEGMTVWQRPTRVQTTIDRRTKKEVKEEVVVKHFGSVQEFLGNLPQVKAIALYEMSAAPFIRLPGYSRATEPVRFSHAIRGSHTLLMYAEGESIDFSFQKRDLNRSSGADPLRVRVLSGTRTLFNERIADDGDRSANGRMGSAVPFRLLLPIPNPGLYTIELQAGEDVLIDQIVSLQHNVAFDQHLFLADGPAYASKSAFKPLAIKTNGTEFRFETAHEHGLQTFLVNGKKYRLPNVKLPLKFSMSGDEQSIKIKKGDIAVDTNGYIVPEPFQLFSPSEPRTLSVLNDDVLSNVDYLVSSYKPQPYRQFISIKDTQRIRPSSSATLKYEIRAPGLYAEKKQLVINQIRAKFSAPPVTLKGFRQRFLKELRQW